MSTSDLWRRITSWTKASSTPAGPDTIKDFFSSLLVQEWFYCSPNSSSKWWNGKDDASLQTLLVQSRHQICCAPNKRKKLKHGDVSCKSITTSVINRKSNLFSQFAVKNPIQVNCYARAYVNGFAIFVSMRGGRTCTQRLVAVPSLYSWTNRIQGSLVSIGAGSSIDNSIARLQANSHVLSLSMESSRQCLWCHSR
jgi:hypothetical protein